MKVLVIAEHDNKKLKDSTLNTVEAAKKISNDIKVLVIGHNSDDVRDKASFINGVTEVLHIDKEIYENFISENISEAILTLLANEDVKFTHVLVPSGTFSKNFLPRIAAKLDVAMLTDVIEIIDEKTFKRPIYAGNIISTVELNEPVKIMSIRASSFSKGSFGGSADITETYPVVIASNTKFVSLESGNSTGPDLTTARVVVTGGRALGSKENFKIIESLSSKIKDSAVGASRAAVDAGYISNEHQVGQTGKIVAPELYIAIGVSGAIQHIAGMKDSKIIVAINKDENAQIFEYADIGIVADLFEVLPEMEKLI